MSKRITPEQLELVKDMSREELIKATAPHIDFDSPAMKEDLAKIEKIALAEAATVALNRDAPVMGSGYAFRHLHENDFDWNDDDSIVLREQPATAIYHNSVGTIIIRQKADWDAEHDTFAYLTPENAVTFMEALAKVHRKG